QRKSDGRWVASFRLPNGGRKYVYRESKAEARDALKRAQREMEQGTLITTRDQTLRDHMEQWLKVKRLELKDGTYCYYKYNTDVHILPRLGHIKLQKLTAEDIQHFYTDLLKELSPNTVRSTIHTVLRSALEAAVKRKKIASNPCQDVTLPRPEKKDIAFLTQEQATRLLEAAKGRTIEPLIVLALATGMRRGEMLALEWPDIDFERKSVSVCKSLSYHDADGSGKKYKVETPKTASSKRTIPLPDFAIEALQQHRHVQREQRARAPTWDQTLLVFTNSTGSYSWYKIVDEQFKSLLQAAGLPRMRFHDLRHSAATILLALGVNAKVIQDRLGHSRIATTLDTYSHVTKSMQEDATSKLDAHFHRGAGTQP
ncbi:MAG TPA: site-specific integrase, partial [Ktedonobacteraceae bacterium]